MDTAKLSHDVSGKVFFFVSPYLKIGALYFVGSSFFLLPLPLPLFPFPVFGKTIW